jgi:hypothetical protein
MTGFGAIVKSVMKWVAGATAAAESGLRLALGGRRPVPCPIPVPAGSRGRRR